MSSLKTRIEKLEHPEGKGAPRLFGNVDHLAEDIQAARLAAEERRRRGEPEPPWSERKEYDVNAYDHPLDRALVEEMNAAIRRMKKWEAEGKL